MKDNKNGVSAIIGVILMIAITVAIACTVYIYVANMFDNEYYIETGIVVKTEVFYGGCQHTDFCNIYFANNWSFWFNPSIEIVEFLPLNETYSFYLKEETNSDGLVILCDRIDNQYGEEIWRSCRY